KADCLEIVRAFAVSFEETVDAVGSPWLQDAPACPLVVRVIAPPGQLSEIAESGMRLGASVATFAASGGLRLECSDPAGPWLQEIAALRERLAPHGAVIIEAAPANFKREVDVWGSTRTDFTLMRRLKEEFDPNHVLNPGRFVGGI